VFVRCWEGTKVDGVPSFSDPDSRWSGLAHVLAGVKSSRVLCPMAGENVHLM
jgi:hypothetical protein